MSLLIFQHHPDESSAVFGAVLQNYGHDLRTIKLHDGQLIPPDLDDVDGIVSMGGPMNIDQSDQYTWLTGEMAYLKRASEAGLPVVGICLGAQLLAAALGGLVTRADQPEIGWHKVRLAFSGTVDPVYAGIRWDSIQFQMHAQEVSKLPSGATVLAGSRRCKIQAFKAGLNAYGFQYHFEWTRHNMKLASQDVMVEEAGVVAENVLNDTDRHYDGYRRQGDRLCHNLAILLFPIDRR